MNAVSGVVELARPLDFSNANTIGITVIAEVGTEIMHIKYFTNRVFY